LKAYAVECAASDVGQYVLLSLLTVESAISFCGGVNMPNTIRAVVRGGKIEPLEKIEIPDGTEVLVTPLIDEPEFWLGVGERSLDSVWDNAEDDVYAGLLEK
jgi:hypothetical protein